MRYDRDGVPVLSLEEYESAIDRVMEEDIRRVFRRLLNHQVKNFLMLFYGDIDRIKDALRRGDIMGRTTVFDIQTLIE